jgi:hypothetical protein
MTSPLFCRYSCPDCAGKFRWPFGDTPPLYCPLCSAYVGEEETEFTPKAPAIRTAGNQLHDKLYRDMEKASVEQADKAHEIGGGDRADYSHMHMTNMRDNVKEGEVSAISPANPVKRFMQQYPQAPVGNRQSVQAEGFAAMAHQPIDLPDGRQIDGYAHAGAHAAGTIQERHIDLMRAMQAKGQIN